MEEFKKRIIVNLKANARGLNKKIAEGKSCVKEQYIIDYDPKEWLKKIELGCIHCGIMQSQLNAICDKMPNPIRHRGRILEIDRKYHDRHYKRNNIQLSCYWCNNARSNQFSNEDFKPIAEKIGKFLKSKLKISN